MEAVDKASRQLEATLKFCAKNLSDKYLSGKQQGIWCGLENVTGVGLLFALRSRTPGG